jgi:hypothetical protein
VTCKFNFEVLNVSKFLIKHQKKVKTGNPAKKSQFELDKKELKSAAIVFAANKRPKSGENQI